MPHFDYVIGNPPFHETTEGTSDKPLYNAFMSAAYGVSDKVMLVTPGRFLFGAGKTPRGWTEQMLNDPHLKVEQYEQDSSVFFPGTDIKGGVAITYHDKERDFGAIGMFTVFPELNSIIKKVTSATDFTSLNNIMYLQNNFALDILLADHPEYKPMIGSDGREKRVTTSILKNIDAFRETGDLTEDYQILGIIDLKRVSRFISQKYIEDNGNLHTYKVIVPRSNGSGALGEVLATPLIGEPLIGYSQSFLGIGSFQTKEEAEACLKYIKTKFARVMLGVLKVTQHNPPVVWKYVPLQNFSANSDLAWELNVPALDQTLYKKYNLTAEEIDFIESHVKAMS